MIKTTIRASGLSAHTQAPCAVREIDEVQGARDFLSAYGDMRDGIDGTVACAAYAERRANALHASSQWVAQREWHKVADVLMGMALAFS